ncbi:methylated-DNA--[protein]-cysteine S-methyltransferase [Mycobacterium dioxanotrophicus]|jgi:methylated-DNA-[protein]-cysteine S-methyltransferase|nr:methylated-DNA--[protein]-cysteine S-methyltransferase [Mycobacterium dioxanotrophicus]
MSDPMTAPTWHCVVENPLGRLTLVRDETGLCGLYFPHHWYRPDPVTFGRCRDDGFDDVIRQLDQYLAGERTGFELPLNVHGDPFQAAVWRLVTRIPYGVTTTYGALAAHIDGATAQQVGVAVGRNPLSVIVPCHRVVGQGGKLTGYAGGITRKRFLLELERDHRRAAGAGSDLP